MINLPQLAERKRLHVLFALHVLGRPAGQAAIKSFWGARSQVLSDDAIAEGVAWLMGEGAIIPVPGGRHPAYQLSDQGQQLLLPIAKRQLTPRHTESATVFPVSDSVPHGVNPSAPPFLTPHHTESGNLTPHHTGSEKLTPHHTESDFQETTVSGRNLSDPVPHGVNPPQEEEDIYIKYYSWDLADLPKKYNQVLEIAGVFANIREILSAELATEGAAYLPHLIGHLAYAVSGECKERPYRRVRSLARMRENCQVDWLPPRHLTFDQALAWAREGKPATAPKAEAYAPPAPAPAIDLLAPAIPASAAAILWQLAKEQLALEMPAATFRAWVHPIVAGVLTTHQLTVYVPHATARDWLTHQLGGTITRVVSNLVGHPCQVILALAPDPEPPTTPPGPAPPP